MTLAGAQRLALEVLRPQRSSNSYFAGSLVLARNLQRLPGDFDLHHRDWVELERALSADRAALARARIEDRGLERHDFEYQGWHGIDGVVVEINWVLDTAPLMFAPRSHPELGYALHPFDVAAKKLAMALEEDDPKHRADLARLKAQGFPLSLLADHAARLPRHLGRRQAREALSRLLDDLEEHGCGEPKTD